MNLLITGAWKYTPEQLETIKAMGHTVFVLQNEQDALPIPYEKVEGVICNGLFLHHKIQRFTTLRYIQLTSAGLDRVPLDDIRARGIALHNAQGVYSIPMAEFVLAGVLQIYKQGRFFADNQKQHAWRKHKNLLELYGKRVCVVGCGAVGTECARRFAAFGCRVIGLNRSRREDDAFDLVLPLDALADTVVQADIVVIAAALTEQTRHLINKEIFDAMKPGCVLVNVARGAIVDTTAMLAALEQKKLFAVLDVFEDEPLDPDSPLWDMENVILTPHNSFAGDGNADRLFALIQRNLQDA